jgi:hypothetical protein
VPRRLPWLGEAVWMRADIWWRQQLAVPFMRVWRELD